MGSSTFNPEDEDDSATISDGSTTKTDSDSETETDEERRPRPPPSLPPRDFEAGEKVLAYHKNRIYEAKVVKIDHSVKEWRYYVHYPGWNKNWDEWVGGERLLKYNEENLQKKEALDKKLDAEKQAKGGRTSQIKPRSSVGRGRKRKSEFLSKANSGSSQLNSKEKCPLPSENLMNLQIPPTLKKQLIDDCEFIKHLGKLVKLPRTPNVVDILKKYEDYRLKKDGSVAESVKEILNGLLCYFDESLPAMLLYQSERQQYSEATKENVKPSMIYGAEHLLRLFVKLPELLAEANIEEETLTEIQQKLVDFLKFLQKNQSAFFLSTYHVPEESETSTNKQED